MSSATWKIASMKKSIMFDVLGVIDRANRIKAKKTIFFDYSLLKEDTVKKFDAIYKAAKNQSELLHAVFYVPVKKPYAENFTVIYECFINIAFNKSSFDEIITWIKKSDRSDFAYYIAAKCLSTADNEVSVKEIACLVNEGDAKVINALDKAHIPEKVKMSVYMMIFSYNQFLQKLIKYLNDVYMLVFELYCDLVSIFRSVESMLTVRLKDKKERSKLLSAIGLNKKPDECLRKKSIVVLSLIRLEYCWAHHTMSSVFYVSGLFFIQRIIHDSEFEIF